MYSYYLNTIQITKFMDITLISRIKHFFLFFFNKTICFSLFKFILFYFKETLNKKLFYFKETINFDEKNHEIIVN